MKRKPPLTVLGLGLALSAGVGCSKSDSPPAATPTTPGAMPAPGTMTGTPTTPVTPGTVSATPGACASNVLEVAFSPMFSAFDGVHTFQVPAIVDGILPTAITWSSSDPTTVDLQPDVATGGVLITTRKPGVVDIIATAGGLCGAAKLTIAAATPDDWEAGSKRYNEGVVLRGLPRPQFDGGAGGPGGPNAQGPTDAGPATEAACTNCHGPTANGPFKTVAHTPTQIGGFNDAELTDIFTKGIVPMGGYFDETIVPYNQWRNFHKWDMTPEAAKGMVVYLRSLTPAPQTGARNFGGRMFGDGGMRGPRDGGGRREAGGDPADAGATD
jgi:hypothetical protein